MLHNAPVADFTPEQRLRAIQAYVAKQRLALAAQHRNNAKAKAVAAAECDAVEHHALALFQEAARGKTY